MKRVGNEPADGIRKARRKPGRVPTSCAECRRLKLRCDKSVPCEKCVSRGCGSICPEGTLAPGKGNRLVLANTEELHDRIEQLCVRIRELENALRTLQESVSTDPHPLLQTTPGILGPILSQPLQRSSPASSPSSHDSPPAPQEPNAETRPTCTEDESLVDAFGTLTLGRHGESTFYGQTARAEYLITAPSFSRSRTSIPHTQFSMRFADPSLLGPDRSIEGVGDELFSLLPQLPEAIHLCEVYLLHGKYMYPPIPRGELFDDVLEPVYRAGSFENIQCYHIMAVLLGVFAIGALIDTDRQPLSPEFQEYCYLARVALACNPQVTRWSIIGHVLVAQSLFYSDCDHANSNSSYMYIGHAVRLGHSIGLREDLFTACSQPVYISKVHTTDLDSMRWKLSPENVERRRRLFWLLFVFDTWTSFCFGRPPIMDTAYIDCPLPRETQDLIADGDKLISFHSWTRQYAILVHSVMATSFGAKQPPYSTIIAHDRKIRDFPIPALWRPVTDSAEGPAPTVSLELNMHRWLCMSRKEMTLLNLHRPYFTQALKDMPMDLGRHRYVPSVIAIFRSAWRIIEGLEMTWRRVPQELARFNLAWSQGLAAGIVMCLLITRAPTSNMTTSALAELDTVLKLFEEGSVLSPSVARFIDSIRNLHRKAHESVDQRPSHSPTTITPSELDRLSGTTHLLADTGARDSGVSGPSDSVTYTNTLGAQGLAAGMGPDFFLDANGNSMHPTIAQDMRSFDMGSASLNNFAFDFPAAPSPTSQFPTADLRCPDISFYPMPSYQTYQASEHSAGFEPLQTAPVLDATWQSFVEQLGF